MGMGLVRTFVVWGVCAGGGLRGVLMRAHVSKRWWKRGRFVTGGWCGCGRLGRGGGLGMVGLVATIGDGVPRSVAGSGTTSGIEGWVLEVKP